MRKKKQHAVCWFTCEIVFNETAIEQATAQIVWKENWDCKHNYKWIKAFRKLLIPSGFLQ